MCLHYQGGLESRGPTAQTVNDVIGVRALGLKPLYGVPTLRAQLNADLSTLTVTGDKYAIIALLCNTQYFHMVGSDGNLNNTHRMHCCVATATMVKRTRHYIM